MKHPYLFITSFDLKNTKKGENNDRTIMKNFKLKEVPEGHEEIDGLDILTLDELHRALQFYGEPHQPHIRNLKEFKSDKFTYKIQRVSFDYSKSKEIDKPFEDYSDAIDFIKENNINSSFIVRRNLDKKP